MIPDGADPGAPLAEARDVHDATYDEHRIVSMLSPVTLREGRYRIALELETKREKRTLEYRFQAERLLRAPS